MILKVYLIILAYFFAGVIGFYFINRRKEKTRSRKSWKKTLVYFIIINIVALSIVINPIAFRFIALLIIIEGFYELFKLFRGSDYKSKKLFVLSILVFALFSYAFFYFSGLSKELIFFSFAILSIFDSFSQITGELWGRKKIAPKISPNKTVEGFIGGSLVALISGILLKGLIGVPWSKSMAISAGVALFAFLGDLAASFYKRNYNVKDFSNLLPENGGFLDRFDSLVAGGAWIAFITIITNIL